MRISYEKNAKSYNMIKKEGSENEPVIQGQFMIIDQLAWLTFLSDCYYMQGSGPGAISYRIQVICPSWFFRTSGGLG